MHEKLLPIKEKLDQLHKIMEELVFPYEDLTAWGGYQFPYLTKDDIVYFPSELMERLSLQNKYVPSTEDNYTIDSIISIIEKTKDHVSSITSGNVTAAVASLNSYLLSMFFVSDSLNRLFSFEVLSNRELLPKRIINRLSFYEGKLNEIGGKTGDIDSKISTIIEAYDAAETLPTTLQSLRDTNSEIETLKIQSQVCNETVVKNLQASSVAKEEVEKLATNLKELSDNMMESIDDYMKNYQLAAQNYIDKCEEAFRTTTSKGLAGAFQDKAEKLNRSIQCWVLGLVAALIAGACVGYYRLHALEAFLADPNSSGVKIFIQLTLSIFSVGAPLWFAWLATKQIGQRFRLAEDYEFKASVSKAYEGYRREALSLDSDFSQRLFGNALTRLEEPPLRFVEESAHSSPLMELLSSDKFKDIFSKGDDAVDAIMNKYGWKRKNNKDNEKLSQESEQVGTKEKNSSTENDEE
ncbi:hypothetical protein [Pantoea sp.]|uniref:hypothetical protein n=1 Tax=Pantoea sp. TaxID=69393 RepID=UPI0028A59509|nr:hypothetical protein [Pantoea sp.]